MTKEEIKKKSPAHQKGGPLFNPPGQNRGLKKNRRALSFISRGGEEGEKPRSTTCVFHKELGGRRHKKKREPPFHPFT